MEVGKFAGLAHVVVILTLASCGGQALAPDGDSGGSQTDGGAHTDTGDLDHIAPSDGASRSDTALPDPDSSRCDIQEDSGNVVCVLCSDQKWHCGLQVLPQCLAGTKHKAPCSTFNEQCFTSCVSAADGASSGDWYTCEPGHFWSTPMVQACSN